MVNMTLLVFISFNFFLAGGYANIVRNSMNQLVNGDEKTKRVILFGIFYEQHARNDNIMCPRS